MGQVVPLRRPEREQEALLDKKGIARVLCVSPRTINNYVNAGMPHVQGRHQKRFCPSECVEWFRQR